MSSKSLKAVPETVKFSYAVSLPTPCTPEHILAPVYELAEHCRGAGFKMPLRITGNSIGRSFTMTAEVTPDGRTLITFDGEQPEALGLPMTATVREVTGDRSESVTVVPELGLRLKPEFEVGLCMPRSTPIRLIGGLMLFCNRCVAYGLPLPLQMYVHLWRPGLTLGCTVIAGPEGQPWFTTDGHIDHPGFVKLESGERLYDPELALSTPATVYIADPAPATRMAMMHVTDWQEPPRKRPLPLPGLPGGARLH